MKLKIEIKGKDEFWERAFHVEWSDQFPDRKIASDTSGLFLVAPEWLEDLERIGAQTFCTVIQAPENPGRRRWMNSLMTRRAL
ncbi:MAG TPA: hypothetical protein VN743_00855 [Blastocatellia bacterium]|nr:hypothetical protein [Blastocatellia bacterium]